MDSGEEQVENTEPQFEKQLSEIVRKHPCLYDKTCRGFKDSSIVDNAWLNVSERLKLANGEEARRLFENLKKRYNKKRNSFKKLQYTGASEIDIGMAKKNLDQYRFMSWLIPYIKVRRFKTALSPRTAAVAVDPIDNVCKKVTYKQEHSFERMENELRFEEQIDRSPEDSIDLFARLMTTEMRKLSVINQTIAKNQIQNLIYNLLMEQEQQQAQ